jgi:hypothetical protein
MKNSLPAFQPSSLPETESGTARVVASHSEGGGEGRYTKQLNEIKKHQKESD